MTQAGRLPSDIARRLALIRLLYRQGVEQSRLPEPMRFFAVLTFQDSVELFLGLAAEHLQVALSDRINFLAYWDEIAKRQPPINLVGKSTMDKLNRVRVQFKHHGIIPNPTVIDDARAHTASFFEDNTPIAFGVQFDDISMADVIPQAEVRDTVKHALTLEGTGERIEAMAFMREAFDILFAERMREKRPRRLDFSFGRALMYPVSESDITRMLSVETKFGRRAPLENANRFAKDFTTLLEMTTSMRQAMRITTLGIDFWRYIRFVELTPSVYRTADSQRHLGLPDGYSPNADEFEYCVEFIVTAALRLAEVEGHLVPPSWV